MRTRAAALGSILAAGALALTACGPTGHTAATAPASVSAAAANAANTGGAATTAAPTGSLSLIPGTAQQYNAPADTGDFFQGPAGSPEAAKWVQLSAGAAGGLNPVVVNGAGFTLYRFDKDTAAPSKSNCNDACATTWPPVVVDPGSKIFVDGVPQNKVGVVRRDDGRLQVTVGGWPVYRFSKDTTPGQTNGQGVGGTWFGVTPEGGKAGQAQQGTDSGTGLDYASGTAQQHHAPANTGDFYHGSRSAQAAMKWVQLTAGSANGLSPIVHDGAGFTLYRFDKDTATPSKSNCNDACATTWPPVLVQHGSKIFVDGVRTSEIGVVRRDDGRLQVTIGGWPVYRFSKDTAPGQTNGEGVGGTWFAVSPQGQKVLPPVSTGDPGAAPSAPAASASPSAVALGNGSAILDSGTNFSEPDGSAAVAGPGCQTIAPFTARSVQLAGGPIKIWTGPNCTGTSAVLSASVADLSTIGFTKPIASVRFAG